MRSAPPTPTGWLLLTRTVSGAWLVMTHPEHGCPLYFAQETPAMGLAESAVREGHAVAALPLEVAIDAPREAILTDWAEVSDRCRERSERSIATRTAQAAVTVGYILIGRDEAQGVWQAVCDETLPCLYESEAEAVAAQERQAREGRETERVRVLTRLSTLERMH